MSQAGFDDDIEKTVTETHMIEQQTGTDTATATRTRTVTETVTASERGATN
jgi:hypothetical protein